MSKPINAAPERNLLTIRPSSSTAASRLAPSSAAAPTSPALLALKRRHDDSDAEGDRDDSTRRSDGEPQREGRGSEDEGEEQWQQRERGGSEDDGLLSRVFRSDGGDAGDDGEDTEEDEQQQQPPPARRPARVLKQLILRPSVQQQAAVPASSSSAEALLAPASSSLADWTRCLTGSPDRHVVDSGLFLLQSAFLTFLCYDAAGGRYRHAAYPPPAAPVAASDASAPILFPSVLNAAVVQERGEQWLYAKDALLQHRMQVHAGKLLAWKDGERRKVKTAAQQSRADKAKEKQQQQLRQQSRSRAGEAAFGDEEDSGDDCGAEPADLRSASASTAAELLDGRLLQCAHTRQARVLLLHDGSRAQSAFQPSDARFLSPKRDGALTVCVRKPRKQEGWKLLPLSALRFSSLAHATSLLAGLKAKAERKQREEERRLRDERWQQLYPRDVRLGEREIAEWRRRREEESQADWERCQDAEVRQRILTIVLPASAQAAADSSWPTFQRFSSAGMRARMHEMPVSWRPAADTGIRLDKEDRTSSSAGRPGEESDEEEEAGGFAEWDPAAEMRSERRRVEHRWRREQLQKQMTTGSKRDRKRIRRPACDPSPPPADPQTARRQQEEEQAASARQEARESRQRQREQETRQAEERETRAKQEAERRRQREAEPEKAQQGAEAGRVPAQAVQGRRRLRKLLNEDDLAGKRGQDHRQEQQDVAAGSPQQAEAAPYSAERPAAAAAPSAAFRAVPAQPSPASSAEPTVAATAAAAAALSQLPSICRPEWSYLFIKWEEETLRRLQEKDEWDSRQRSG